MTTGTIKSIGHTPRYHPNRIRINMVRLFEPRIDFVGGNIVFEVDKIHLNDNVMELSLKLSQNPADTEDG